MAGSTTMGSPSNAEAKIAGIDFVDSCDGFQAVPAVANFGGKMITRPSKLTQVRAQLGTNGGAGATTLEVRKNGVQIAGSPISFPSTDADGANHVVGLDVDLEAGDRINFRTTAAGAGSADLCASAVIARRFDS